VIQSLHRLGDQDAYALTYTLTLRARSSPPWSISSRRNPAILRDLSVAVRRSPVLSCRGRWVQVPSTPQK
jgi:hypothetical protein